MRAALRQHARSDAAAIAQGRRLVGRAARLGQPGPYVLQAAIVATHQRLDGAAQ